MTKPLTPAQREVMGILSHRVGETVDVATGEQIASMNPNWRPLFRTTAAALRGLEARGYITARHFWRGATVTVLKKAEA